MIQQETPQEKRNKKTGIITTSVIHLVLIILASLMFDCTGGKDVQGHKAGVRVQFGFDDTGSGEPDNPQEVVNESESETEETDETSESTPEQSDEIVEETTETDPIETETSEETDFETTTNKNSGSPDDGTSDKVTEDGQKSTGQGDDTDDGTKGDDKADEGEKYDGPLGGGGEDSPWNLANWEADGDVKTPKSIQTAQLEGWAIVEFSINEDGEFNGRPKILKSTFPKIYHEDLIDEFMVFEFEQATNGRPPIETIGTYRWEITAQ
jgi:hypothetical protein